VTDSPTPELRIVSKNATDEEIAAVTAVLQSALEELADAEAAGSGARVSAWARSQRPIRGTITPGAGNWRGFEG